MIKTNVIHLLLARIEANKNQTIGKLRIYNETADDSFKIHGAKHDEHGVSVPVPIKDVSEIKDLACYTLELPWLNNKKRVSCIPSGSYKVTLWNSPKFGDCLKVHDVPGRTNILIHPGNYFRNTLGCILPGLGLDDVDNDGFMDVTESRLCLSRILNHVIDTEKDNPAVGIKIHIVDCFTMTGKLPNIYDVLLNGLAGISEPVEKYADSIIVDGKISY